MESSLVLEKEMSKMEEDIILGKWNETYQLNKNFPFWYRLGDSSFLIKKFQAHFKSDENFKKHFQDQLSLGHELTKVQLWLNVSGKPMMMTVMDIYCALMEHLKNGSFEQQLYDCYEVSFVGPLGPFKNMTLLQCLNDDLIEKFIFSYVLQNKLPTRSFRLHTCGQINIECGEELDKNYTLKVKQITDNGILFSSHNDLLLEEIEQGELVKFYLDTTNINKIIKSQFGDINVPQDMFYTENNLRYFYMESKDVVKSLSYNSALTNEVYFFCRYHNMLESDVPAVLSNFVEKAKSKIKDIA